MSCASNHSIMNLDKDISRLPFLENSSTHRLKSALDDDFHPWFDDMNLEYQTPVIKPDQAPSGISIDSEATENYWHTLVQDLQRENASLMFSLRETQAELDQCRSQKYALEEMMENHMKVTNVILTKLRNDAIQRIRKEKSLRTARRSLETEIQPSVPVSSSWCVQVHPPFEQAPTMPTTEDKEVQTDSSNLAPLAISDVCSKQSNASPSVSPGFVPERSFSVSGSLHESSYEDLLHEIQNLQQQRLDLMFQKRYLTLVNTALASCESRSMKVFQALGIASKDITTRSPRQRWRACCVAIIAIYRLRRSKYSE
ncbi:uncharacterized protein BYT42DRAFT_583602 [Radiomyces spectabilis]|uniref:uncharacterized protein n=1 Tax=Radiomyces spectabilis TaxID=64574 RepID=UPI00221F440F|nr:uncharacterized protein BYT42DRAFT_583602 [Radiomyces spectabilis]KAI8369232.1 hypothetical protein BYT42DRAFT_583602 [Radiomyces spectabilis]